MLTVTIYKGLPASGKSTEAKDRVAKSRCAIKRVNKDDLRAMLDSGKHSKGNEAYILQLRDSIILTALDLGKSVIVDDTNFYPKHEENIRQLVKDFNAGMYGDAHKNPVQVKVKYFEATPEECIERDLKRPNSVGAKVIWDMYNTYIKKEEPKKIRELMKQDENLPHAIICDLDGTIALMNDRSPYDWEKCDTDLPNRPIIALVETYLSYMGNVIFLSGRDGRAREKTIQWIKDNIQLMDKEYELWMRKSEDNRKDSIIKKELFDAHIKGKYYIDFVLDDRLQVCRLWHSMGLTVLRVGDPDAYF